MELDQRSCKDFDIDGGSLWHRMRLRWIKLHNERTSWCSDSFCFFASLFLFFCHVNNVPTDFNPDLSPDGSGSGNFLNIAQSESSSFPPLCVLTWRRQPPCCFASLSAERSGDGSGVAVSLWFTFRPGPHGPAAAPGLRHDTSPFVLYQPLLWRQGRCRLTTRLAAVSSEANWPELY